MKRIFLMLFLFTMTTGIVTDLWAQEGPIPKLFLLPTQSVQDSMSTIVPEKIGELLRERIVQEGKVELMPDLTTVKANLGGNAQIVEAEQLYTSGIGQLTAGNDKKAVEAFGRSIEIMESNLSEANFDILADAIGNLALANFNAGFDLDARKGIKFYAYIRPEVVLDKEKFPKALVKIHQDTIKKIKKAGPGILKIKSNGEGIIYIDGVEKGKAPGTVSDIGFGHHYLIVKCATGDTFASKIKVRGKKKKQDFNATLQPSGAIAKNTKGGLPEYYSDLLVTLKSGNFDETVKPYLSELANRTGADYIGFVLMLRKGSDYIAAPFVFRKSDERLVRSTDESFNIELSNLIVGVNDLSKNLVESLKSMPESALVSTVKLMEPAKKTTVVVVKKEEKKTETKVVSPPPVVNPSESSNTWVYVTVGTLAAVGLIAGGVYLLRSSDSGGESGSGFTAEVSW